jgi:hypothetical protein
VSFAKQRNSFRIEFRETKSETSFAGNPNHIIVSYSGISKMFDTLPFSLFPLFVILPCYGSGTLKF